MHLGILTVCQVPLSCSLVQLVQVLVGDFSSCEVGSVRFSQPGNLGSAGSCIHGRLDVRWHTLWQRGWRRSKAWYGLLHIDDRLDRIWQTWREPPVPDHGEHGEHEDDGWGRHKRWWTRYVALGAGFALLKESCFRGSGVDLFDLAVHVGARRRARMLSCVHA